MLHLLEHTHELVELLIGELVKVLHEVVEVGGGGFEILQKIFHETRVGEEAVHLFKHTAELLERLTFGPLGTGAFAFAALTKAVAKTFFELLILLIELLHALAHLF